MIVTDYAAEISTERDWLRKSQLILLYHTFCQLQYGTKRGHIWTIERTAKALSLSKGYISEAIHLAKHYIERPDMNREQALRKMKGEQD